MLLGGLGGWLLGGLGGSLSTFREPLRKAVRSFRCLPLISPVSKGYLPLSPAFLLPKLLSRHAQEWHILAQSVVSY